jgi:hypothetical protein
MLMSIGPSAQPNDLGGPAPSLIEAVARATASLQPAPEGKDMTEPNTVVAVFKDHEEADAAVRKLAGGGIDMKHLSVVGKGYHTDEKVIGFYNMGDRVKFWGTRGAFWGGLWGWLFGGVFLMVPVFGHLVVIGYLAAMVVSALEGAVVVGGLSALGAALYSSGIPKNSIVAYESALKADGFLVMARGTAEEMSRAKAILSAFNPQSLDLHETLVVAEPVKLAV